MNRQVVLFLLLVELCGSFGANQTLQAQEGRFPTWNCDRATCQSVEVPLGQMKVVNVAVAIDDFVLVYGEGYKFLGVAHKTRRFAATNCVLDNLKMFISARHNVSIIVHDGTSYVLDERRVGLSFGSPTEVIQAFYEMYDNQATPFIKGIDGSENGFDMRQLLVYLAEHGSIKGAPTLKGKRKLERKLLEYFGEEFEDVARLYKGGEVAVGDYEAVFYYLVIGGKEDNRKLYNYVASLALNQILTDPEIPSFFEDFNVFQSYALLHRYSTNLYPNKEDAVAAYKAGTFWSSSRYLGKHHKVHFARDQSTANYVVRLESDDGKVDTYTTYNPSSTTWTFHCRLTGYLLVFPKCPNFALYNGRTGTGIVVSKQAQVIQVESLDYRKNRFHQAIAALTSTTCSATTSGTFNFDQLLHHAHYLGTSLFLPCDLETKLKLHKHFKTFVRSMHSTDSYDGKDGYANAVLHFFRGKALRTLKVDRRKMVRAIATGDSLFYADAMLTALFYCDMEKCPNVISMDDQ